MSLSVSDPTTGWSFTYQTDSTGRLPPPGGLVLNMVQHVLHNFARDMRLVGVRLKVQEIDRLGMVVSSRSVYLPLSDPPFSLSQIELLPPISVINLSVPGGTFNYLREAEEALSFSTYFREPSGNYVAYGIRSDYTLPASYFAAHFPNCEQESLNISQRFLFAAEGNSPPHEPSGGLLAARCHPIVKYLFTDNSSIDRSQRFTRIDSVRFDYRFYLFLDRHHLRSVSAGLPNLGNQAGLFRDNEVVSVLGAGSGFFSPRLGAAASGAAFAAVEKPLVHEVVAPGLEKGFSVFTAGGVSHTCWDNLHWWGVRDGGTYISAPGAFHAAHIHWRWGAAGSSIRSIISTMPEIDTSGVPVPAQGSPLAGGIRGALVDPSIWMQTIRVAVTLNEPTLDPHNPGVRPEDLCREDWKTLFTSLRSTPIDIFSGGDLVFWYSAEVHRSVDVPAYGTVATGTYVPARTYYAGPGGSVFLHGIFFAHRPEVTGPPVGSTGAQHWPKSEATLRSHPEWFRSAE